MNILIIDDDIIKKDILSNALMKLDPNNKIKWFDNYQNANQFILDNKDYIDLILLDWCFPPNSYSRCKYGMGMQILNSMAYNDIHIKTIICSSDEISLEKDIFPFVSGSILFDRPVKLINTLDSFIKDDNPYINEEQNVKVRTKCKHNNSGYKRRMSSTPWWMK